MNTQEAVVASVGIIVGVPGGIYFIRMMMRWIGGNKI